MTANTSAVRYSLLDVGLSGLLLQAIAGRTAPLLPHWISANSITMLGGLGCIGVVIVMKDPGVLAGMTIVTVLFLDFLDGSVARYRGSESQFGKVLDGTVDLLFWLAIVLGLYMSVAQALSISLLAIYTVDLSWRILLGHSSSLLDHGGERYNEANRKNSVLTKLKPYIYPFINYYDSIVILSSILIVVPENAEIWLWYEILRRCLLLIKKMREIWRIYSRETLFKSTPLR